MRILIDAHVFDEFFQGTRSYLEGLYSAVFLLEDRNPSGRTYYLAARNIASLKKIFPERPYIKFVQLRSKRSWGRLLLEFPRIIKKYRIDYAHFQYVVPFYGRCRYINTIHDLIFLDKPEYFSWYYRNARKWLFHRSYKRAAHVLTVSPYSKRSILKFYGNDKPVTVVPLAMEDKVAGFNPVHRKEAWLESQDIRRYILYVSRFEVRKNHYNLLKAFYEGDFYKTYDLVLIGKKSEKCKDFEDLYAALPEPVKKSVIFRTDGVPSDQLLEFMKHADLFIYPSLAEGFGIPPLEAAVLGTPVICSNTTSMQDFVFFGKDHVDCSTSGQIILAMQAKLNEPASVRMAQSVDIRRTILEKYNWNRSAAIFTETCLNKELP